MVLGQKNDAIGASKLSNTNLPQAGVFKINSSMHTVPQGHPECMTEVLNIIKLMQLKYGTATIECAFNPTQIDECTLYLKNNTFKGKANFFQPANEELLQYLKSRGCRSQRQPIGQLQNSQYLVIIEGSLYGLIKADLENRQDNQPQSNARFDTVFGPSS